MKRGLEVLFTLISVCFWFIISFGYHRVFLRSKTQDFHYVLPYEEESPSFPNMTLPTEWAQSTEAVVEDDTEVPVKTLLTNPRVLLLTALENNLSSWRANRQSADSVKNGEESSVTEDTETTPSSESPSGSDSLSNQSITGVEGQPNLSYVSSLVNTGVIGSIRSLSASKRDSFRDSYRQYFEFKKKSLALTKDWRIYHSRMALYEKKIKRGAKAIKPLPPKPTPKVSLEEDPFFSQMDPVASPAVRRSFEPSTWQDGQTVRIRRFVGNVEVAFNSTRDVFPPADAPLSFSLIAVGSYSRIFFISHLQKRWKGDLSIVLYGTDRDEEQILEYLSQRNYESRVSIVLYLVKNGTKEADVFPINKLRNLGIRATRTTHYIVIDFDVWPANTLYKSIASLDPRVLNRERVAIIIPLFFYDLGVILPQCRSFSSCIRLGDELFPKDRVELIACVRSRVCSIGKLNVLTHNYINPKWFLWNQGPLAKLKCVVNYAQEPYVLLKRSPSTPVFDERFVNYGYNKIQLIEHLRYMDYSFLVLMNSYAMDMPHRMSSMRTSFSKHENERGSMSGLYLEFRKELEAKYTPHSSLELCTKRTYSHLYSKLDYLD